MYDDTSSLESEHEIKLTYLVIGLIIALYLTVVLAVVMIILTYLEPAVIIAMIGFDIALMTMAPIAIMRGQANHYIASLGLLTLFILLVLYTNQVRWHDELVTKACVIALYGTIAALSTYRTAIKLTQT